MHTETLVEQTRLTFGKKHRNVIKEQSKKQKQVKRRDFCWFTFQFMIISEERLYKIAFEYVALEKDLTKVEVSAIRLSLTC